MADRLPPDRRTSPRTGNNEQHSGNTLAAAMQAVCVGLRDALRPVPGAPFGRCRPRLGRLLRIAKLPGRLCHRTGHRRVR
jgi:hypothetical protein